MHNTLATEMHLADWEFLQVRENIRSLVGKPEERSLLGRPRRRWDNIKLDLHELGCGTMDWMELAWDSDRWWALVNAVMNIRVP